MGSSLCSIIPGPKPSNEILELVKAQADKSVLRIPTNYRNEQNRIVAEMKKASPKPYQGLLHSDYPAKNRSQVNALAAKSAASVAVKQELTEEIYKIISPKLNEEISSQNDTVQNAIQRAVRMAIQQAVQQSIDLAIKKVNEEYTKNTTT